MHYASIGGMLATLRLYCPTRNYTILAITVTRPHHVFCDLELFSNDHSSMHESLDDVAKPIDSLPCTQTHVRTHTHIHTHIHTHAHTHAHTHTYTHTWQLMH